MKLSYIIIAIAAVCLSAINLEAASTDLLDKANKAYNEEKYTDAVKLYELAISSVGSSSDAYYNLGNAYYRTGKPGKAVLAYERALRLDPTNSDARQNLEFVNSRLIDRPGEKGTLAGNMVDSASLALHSNTWAWVGFGCFLVFLGAVALYLFCPIVLWRKIGFFGGGVVLLFTLISWYLSAHNAALSQSKNQAIVTASSTILSTSPRAPRDRQEEAILLHEGTKVEVLDSVSTQTDSVKATWMDVRIDNTHRAWINRADIEMI